MEEAKKDSGGLFAKILIGAAGAASLVGFGWWREHPHGLWPRFSGGQCYAMLAKDGAPVPFVMKVLGRAPDGRYMQVRIGDHEAAVSMTNEENFVVGEKELGIRYLRVACP